MKGFWEPRTAICSPRGLPQSTPASQGEAEPQNHSEKLSHVPQSQPRLEEGNKVLSAVTPILNKGSMKAALQQPRKDTTLHRITAQDLVSFASSQQPVRLGFFVLFFENVATPVPPPCSSRGTRHTCPCRLEPSHSQKIFQWVCECLYPHTCTFQSAALLQRVSSVFSDELALLQPPFHVCFCLKVSLTSQASLTRMMP